MKKTIKLLTITIIMNIFLGCTKGIDLPLDTSHGEEAYRSSLNLASKDFSQVELDAFNWAVSNFSIEKLNTEYPNATPKAIIKNEVALIVNSYPDKINELESLKSQYDQYSESISKIKAEEVKFMLNTDFFGLQPTIYAKVSNAGSLDVSSLTWVAKLYINGQDTPVATTELYDSYQKGLRPSNSYNRDFKVGFVSGDANWRTLEIQNAKSTKVVLQVIPKSVEGFNNKSFIGSFYEDLTNLKNTLKSAKSFSSI